MDTCIQTRVYMRFNMLFFFTDWTRCDGTYIFHLRASARNQNFRVTLYYEMSNINFLFYCNPFERFPLIISKFHFRPLLEHRKLINFFLSRFHFHYSSFLTWYQIEIKQSEKPTPLFDRVWRDRLSNHKR